MRRVAVFVMLVVLSLSFFLLSGCVPQSPPKPPTKTQEEFKVEYIKMLDDMVVIWAPDEMVITETLDENLTIWSEKLKVQLHVYGWIGEGDGNIPAPEDVPTYDEVIGLYFEYDEVIFAKFQKFYDWYMPHNGGLGGQGLFLTYRLGMFKAYRLYKKDYGHRINNVESFNKITYEEYLALEEYIKENPDFDNGSKNYQKILDWLGVERPADNETETAE